MLIKTYCLLRCCNIVHGLAIYRMFTKAKKRRLSSSAKVLAARCSGVGVLELSSTVRRATVTRWFVIGRDLTLTAVRCFVIFAKTENLNCILLNYERYWKSLPRDALDARTVHAVAVMSVYSVGVGVRPSVRPSVRLSHSYNAMWLNLSSNFLRIR